MKEETKVGVRQHKESGVGVRDAHAVAAGHLTAWHPDWSAAEVAAAEAIRRDQRDEAGRFDYDVPRPQANANHDGPQGYTIAAPDPHGGPRPVVIAQVEHHTTAKATPDAHHGHER